MTINEATSVLIEHRNNLSIYTSEALEAARLAIQKAGCKVEWIQDDSGFWTLVFN